MFSFPQKKTFREENFTSQDLSFNLFFKAFVFVTFTKIAFEAFLAKRKNKEITFFL